MFNQFYYSTNKTEFPHLRLESLLREFSFDSASRINASNVRPLIAPAMKDLEFLLGTQDYVGKFKFNYTPSKLFEGIKLATSGGCLDTESVSVKIGEVTYKISNNGKKYI